MAAPQRRIVRVTYSKAMDRVRIIFDDRTIYVIPRRLLEGLENAAARELSRIETLDDGSAISWPSLNVKHNLSKLLRGVYGSSDWMACLERMPRAVPGQPMFGSRTKKAEAGTRLFDDRHVLMTNLKPVAALAKRRSTKKRIERFE